MSAPHETLRAMLAFGNPEAVLWDGLDAAIVGIGLRDNVAVAVYDYDAVVNAFLAMNPEWTEEDAVEWVEFNVVGTYAGPGTPIMHYRGDEDDDGIDPWGTA